MRKAVWRRFVFGVACACGALAPAWPQAINLNAELIAAVRSGNLARVATLLEQGADPHSRNRL